MKNDMPPAAANDVSRSRSFLTVALIELWERFGYMVDPLQTLPVYTNLFNMLGMAAIACTLIALAALP